MAFTFTPEDGTGLTDSNSYPSSENADDYFTTDPYFSAKWLAFPTDEAREIRLVFATRVLDYKVIWNGEKAVPASALSFPRTGVYDREGNLVADDIVPLPVIQATLEMVKLLDANDLTAGQDVDYLRRIQVDVIELEYQDRAAQIAIPSFINDILKGFGSIPAGGSRFHRIIKV